jgi:hypothetical protein
MNPMQIDGVQKRASPVQSDVGVGEANCGAELSRAGLNQVVSGFAFPYNALERIKILTRSGARLGRRPGSTERCAPQAEAPPVLSALMNG